MQHKRIVIVLFVVVAAMLFGAVSITAHPSTGSGQAPQANLGTGFTYQGQLKKSNVAVNDNTCSMTFSLWDSQANSTGQVGGNQTIVPVVVTNGLFTVVLNGAGQFGASAFNGDARWLQTSVQCAGDGSPITLSRQALTATPYALFSAAPWVTSGSNIYYNNGNVGIGTTAPKQTLHVAGQGVFTSSSTPFDAGDGAGAAIRIGYDGNNDYGYINANVTGLASKNLILQGNYSQGNVGIGTTSPLARLDVRGAGTSGGTEAFRVANSNGDRGLVVYDNRTVAIAALVGSTTVHACYNAPFVYYFAACSSAAEYVPSIDGGVGFPETADLVSIAPAVTNPYGDTHGPFTVQKSATACDTNLLGFIVNPESGADGEKLNDHYLPLAIYGYFPAKVTTENGVIHRGDPITSSSKPGYGMKATQACKVIGYALEDAEQDGAIQVFAHLSENAATEVQALRAEVQTLKQQNATLQQQNATMDARVAAIEQTLKNGNAPTLAAR